jgi:DNA (cytosine-5)-methyltransferase 1
MQKRQKSSRVGARRDQRDNPYLLRPTSETSGDAEFTAIDLFSGAGGISLGLANAGFRVILASDISAECAATHEQNMPDVPFLKADISRLKVPDLLDAARIKPGKLDLLVGGVPCQGFSILGARKADDPRNRLFNDFFRVAAGLRPKVLIIENVPGLATLNDGMFLRRIAAGFRRLGYRYTCAELLAAQYGAPQMRWRMFFVGVRDDTGLSLPAFPAPTHGVRGIGELVPNRTITTADSEGFLTTYDAIGDLPKVENGCETHHYVAEPKTMFQAAMRHGSDRLTNHYAARMSAVNLLRFKHLRPGQDWRDLPRDLLPPGMQRAALKDHTRRFRRMTWHGVPRSIITRFRDPKSGEYTHPDQDRTITIREAARIQAFPDWFTFLGPVTSQYEQVGNAVPTLLAKAMGVEVCRALEGRVTPVEFRSRYMLPAA